MLQFDKKLCEDLDDLFESKASKEKQIELLREEIQRDVSK